MFSLLICIAFHYNPTNLIHLQTVLNNIQKTYKNTTVIIDTNEEITKKDLHIHNNTNIVVHKNLDHPFALTFQHRKHMIENKDKYDVVMYLEDDILIEYESIVDFMNKIDKLWPIYIPGFRRVEKFMNKYVIVDDDEKISYRINIDDIEYGISEKPYQGFWLLPTKYLFPLENTNAFLKCTSENGTYYREHAASYTLGPPPHHGYMEYYNDNKFLNKISLLEIDNNKLSKKSVVYHLSNKYANKDMISLENYLE